MTENDKLVRNSTATDDESLQFPNKFPHTHISRNNKDTSYNLVYLDYLNMINGIDSERKNEETRKEEIHDTLSRSKRKRKNSTKTTSNKVSSIIKNYMIKNKKSKQEIVTSDSKAQSIMEKSDKQTDKTVSTKKQLRQCDVCFVDFPDIPNLVAHKLYHEFAERKCKVCRRRFISRSRLTSHIILFHHQSQQPRRDRLRSCTFCSRTFKLKTRMQSHLFHEHNELINSDNKLTKSKNDILKTDRYEASLCPSSHNKSEESNTEYVNIQKSDESTTEEPFDNEMTPSKKLRQPTLTEYLEFHKRKRDIKYSPDKLGALKDKIPSPLTLHQDKHIKNMNSMFPEETMRNEQISSLAKKSNSIPGQIMDSTPEENEKYEEYLLKKPFVRLHADVEMMKSFLEGLPDTIIKHELPIEDQTNNTVSYDQELPYSLRSTRTTTSSTGVYSNTQQKTVKVVLKKSQNNAGCSTKTKQNVADSNKMDFLRSMMVHFKCKNCEIPLKRCDEKSKNSTTPITDNLIQENTSVVGKSNSVSIENTTKNNVVTKELKVLVNRLVMPVVNNTKKAISDVKNQDNNHFKCKVCKKSFPSKSTRRRHIKSSHIAYMSSICDARYTTKHKLLQHYFYKHLLKHNQCCVCHKLLPDYMALKRHLNIHCIKYVQREDDQYPTDIEIPCNLSYQVQKCIHCNKIFSSQLSLEIHKNSCRVQKATEDREGTTEKQEENQEEVEKDFSKKINTFPKIVLKVYCNKDTNELTVTRNEKNQPDNLCELSNNESEKQNQIQMSPVNIKKTKIDEDKEKSSVNVTVTENETVNEQDPAKRPENNNSTDQNLASTEPNVETQIQIYPCEICGKRFQNLRNLERHMRTFNSNLTSVCPMCNTKFSSERLLRTHIAAAHVPQFSKNYDFHCVFCNQGFSKKSELRPHVLHLHGHKMIESFASKISEVNKKSNEINKKVAICKVCNLAFESQDRYMEHKMYYYKDHQFTCSLCTLDFQGMYMYHHHNKLVHYSEEQRKSYIYICEICREGFNHALHFYSHNIHVHPSKEHMIEGTEEAKGIKMLDDIAKMQQVNKSSTTNQQKETNQISNEYTCQICQLQCADAHDLAKHVVFYSNDGKFKCDICNRQCRTFDLLNQHKRLTHICRDIYNEYACQICGEVVETLTSLKCHEKHLHSNNMTRNITNNNKCKTCGQKFSSNNASEHRCESFSKIHEAKKRFNCLYCNFKFSSVENIQEHIVKVHFNLSSTSDLDMKSMQQLIELNAELSSKNNSIQSLQGSDNVLNKTSTTEKAKNTTTTKSLSQAQSVLPIDDKFTGETSNLASTIQSEANIGISTTTKIKNNKSKAKATVLIKSTNRSQDCIIIPLTNPVLLSKSKVNFRNSSQSNVNIRSVSSISDSLRPSLTNTSENFKSLNSFTGFTCPLCSLKYPTLMFFHGHLRYAHVELIRTDIVNPQSNQSKKTDTIECLLCPYTFTNESKYKQHLESFHSHLNITNSQKAKETKTTNSLTAQKSEEKNEVIVLDDDNSDKDNNDDGNTTKPNDATNPLLPAIANNKIGKLKVKSFAKIIENLSTGCASNIL